MLAAARSSVINSVVFSNTTVTHGVSVFVVVEAA